MNKYHIQYKISTLAQLIKPFVFNEVEFSSYENEWWKGDAWIAKKEVEASTGAEALNIFTRELIPIIERASLVSQCAFRLIGNSYFIYKLTNNPSKIVYIYYIRPREPVGLHFDSTEVENFKKMINVPNQTFLFYMLEASNATTFYTRLSMLLGAAESLAGELEKNGKKQTNQVDLKALLGTTLYDKLYPYGTGLRHKLLHGKITLGDLNSFTGLNVETYERIRQHLKSVYQIELEGEAVNVPRGFHEEYEFTKTFESFKSAPILNLKIIETALMDSYKGSLSSEQKLFEYTDNYPPNY